jgi:putative ABC transport system permease protein
MYWKYATRSLVRGGQRTLLVIFCVAVGVMAIVALQLVGNMVNEALTGNVREGNGGDIAVRTTVTPLTAQQVGVFNQLKANGTLTDHTAIVSQQATTWMQRDSNSSTPSTRSIRPSFRWLERPFLPIPVMALSPRSCVTTPLSSQTPC